jgi:putative phage-type endonuclease
MGKSTALRLVSTNGLSREDWLKVRQGGIGASDAAAALGISPFKSQLELWLEKTGKVAQAGLSEKEAIYFGTLLEPLVANEYAKRSNNRIRRLNAVLQHPQHTFMLASLDREIVGCVEGPGVLEVKTAGYMSARHWDDGVPFWYETQVMHQLMVTGRDWADVAVLIGGQEYRCYRIKRDEDILREIVKLERQFWHWVTNDVQPPSDGSTSSARALAQLYPRDFGETVDYSAHPVMNQVFSRLIDAREAKIQAEVTEESVKQQIQERMGTVTKAVFVGGEVTWKRTKDGTTIDMEKLKTENPELVKQYEISKPGSRRFSILK